MNTESCAINTILNREARKEREAFKNFLATFAFLAVRKIILHHSSLILSL